MCNGFRDACVIGISGCLRDRQPGAATLQPFLRPRPRCALRCVLSGCLAASLRRLRGRQCRGAVAGHEAQGVHPAMLEQSCSGLHCLTRLHVACLLAYSHQPAPSSARAASGHACRMSVPRCPWSASPLFTTTCAPLPSLCPHLFPLPRSASSPAPPAASPATCGPRLQTSSERGRLAHPLIAAASAQTVAVLGGVPVLLRLAGVTRAPAVCSNSRLPPSLLQWLPPSPGRPDLCAEAAARLKAGLTELVRDGMPAVRKYLEEQGAAPWP